MARLRLASCTSWSGSGRATRRPAGTSSASSAAALSARPGASHHNGPLPESPQGTMV